MQLANTFSGASIEILVIIFVSFVLGYLFRWAVEKWQGDSIIIVEESATEEETDSDSTMIFEPIEEKEAAPDDLKVIEGIGPKIEELLKDNGIKNWEELSKTESTDIQVILDNAGDRFRMHDPETWPEQASLADQGRWSELEEYQEFLNGGKIV